MNANEPVAWMELYFGEPNNLAWINAELKDSGDVYKTIPLYTHPAKTLTDEEIYEVWKKAMQEEAKIEYSIYATQLERIKTPCILPRP